MDIKTLVKKFSVENLTRFFQENIRTFGMDRENYEYLFDEKDYIIDNYKDIVKIGEANLSNSDDILVFCAKTVRQLTDRIGKKRQYDIAKKILREENKDAAFFVFYDEYGNFRFSLIRVNFLGTKRGFTDFKRYTYFVSPSQNKTFIKQINKCDFNNLDSIQEAFSVEPVTKQFYEKLQRWYFWAIKNVKFPEDAEKEPNGREVAIIRLITRIMFIWFMKVRELIPDPLFDEKNIRKILKNVSTEESTYYKAILQNLFFATLSTKQEERKFRSEIRGIKGYNPDFGNHHVFRYQSLFNDPALLKELFGNIPFLNGGLFECLDYKTRDENERKYIDGFTATKKHQPIVPNFLFFSEKEEVDISSFFGKENKTYKVEGLINLLNSYNFTIDENEPDDVEVALDPELLGSIFENLLASYNPETATTARKATGSFYTPREIVNYMTIESLKQYFRQGIGVGSTLLPISKQDALDTLFESGSENPFDEETTKQLIKLINDLRIVDPAVGSGAFPMAMLNKLVFILGKLDPDNKHWKQSQIDGVKKAVSDSVVQRKLIEQIERQFKEKNADYGRKLYLIEKCIYGVDIQQIAVEIAKLRFFISLLVDEKIDKSENNYGIEPLPNLEFKLMQGNSLISTYAGIDFNDKDNGNIDLKIEKVKNQLTEIKNKQKEVLSDFLMIFNRENGREDKGLKNELTQLKKIENKLNKDLKELKKDSEKTQSEKHKKIIKDFEELKHQYQNEADKQSKKELRTDIDKVVIKIFEEKISEHFPDLKRIEEKAQLLQKAEERKKYISEEKQKLTQRLGFDIEQIEKDLIAYTEGRKAKDFFLWNVYFAEVFNEKGGFDVVIGNPPYVSAPTMVKRDSKMRDAIINTKRYSTLYQKWDLYIPFMELSLQLLTNKGVFSMIVPYPFTNQNYALKLRELIINQYNLKEIVDLNGTKIFENATVSNCIPFISKSNHGKACYISKLTETKKIEKIFTQKYTDLVQDEKTLVWNLTSEKRQSTRHANMNVLGDYCYISVGMVLNADEKTAKGEFTKDDLISESYDEIHCRKYIEAKDIEKYNVKKIRYLEYNTKRCPEKLRRPTFRELYEKPKLMFNRLGNLQVYLDETIKFLHSDSMFSAVLWKDLEGVDNKSISASVKRYSNCTRKEMVDFSKEMGLRFLLAVLNSKYVSVLLTNIRAGDYHIYPEHIRNIPIPKITKKEQKPFESLVNEIIAKKERGEDTTAEEQKIDIIVYKLYELTYDEVKIVDPEFALTKAEYENYEH